jgi:hypothetical protein
VIARTVPSHTADRALYVLPSYVALASKTVPGRANPGRNSGPATVGVHTLTSGGLQIDHRGVAKAPFGEKFAPRSGSPATVYTA